MRIKEIMSSPVVTVELDDRLAEIKHIFDNTRFHHLLVVAGGELAGVISDRDLLRALSPYIGTPSEGHRDIATLNKRAHQIMRRNPVTVNPQDAMADAVALFNQHAISCLPVVEAGNRPVGIVSWRDILRSMQAA